MKSHDLARAYREAVLAGRRNDATTLISDAVQAGVPVREIYLEVFQPVQRELGTLWEQNRITVAQEHLATAITQLCMSQLYPQIFSTDRNGLSMIATCVGGELHEIGVRMVADFFEMAGWDTRFYGANTPTDSILAAIHEVRPDTLAVSTSMPYNLTSVVDLISAVRSIDKPVPLILVGGRPFNIDPNLWRTVGADLYAADAEMAIRVAEREVRKRHGT